MNGLRGAHGGPITSSWSNGATLKPGVPMSSRTWSTWAYSVPKAFLYLSALTIVRYLDLLDGLDHT